MSLAPNKLFIGIIVLITLVLAAFSVYGFRQYYSPNATEDVLSIGPESNYIPLGFGVEGPGDEILASCAAAGNRELSAFGLPFKTVQVAVPICGPEYYASFYPLSAAVNIIIASIPGIATFLLIMRSKRSQI